MTATMRFAAAVLPVPTVAMQITNEVKWNAADFIIFGGMLTAACLTFEATMALAKSVDIASPAASRW